MTIEEVMAEIAKQPVIERLPLYNALVQLRLVTIQEVAKAISEAKKPVARTTKKVAAKKAG